MFGRLLEFYVPEIAARAIWLQRRVVKRNLEEVDQI